ncbi:MAG TPA: hypothetical protein VK518_05375 [Puia sp.]|nr:hypothetical protein [Puia sp.]
MKPVSLFVKSGLALLIFFSLQGEVVQRYIQLFQGQPHHHATIPKKTAERLRLNKLQCYTQKFTPVALPASVNIEVPLPVRFLVNTGFHLSDDALVPIPDATIPSLRGPPVLVG